MNKNISGKISLGQLLGLILFIAMILFIVGYFIADEQLKKHDINLSETGDYLRKGFRAAKEAGEEASEEMVESIDIDVREVLPDKEEFSLD